MSVHMILCLVIFVLTIASFLWGKISMGLTALLSMVLLVLTGCIDITTALSAAWPRRPRAPSPAC